MSESSVATTHGWGRTRCRAAIAAGVAVVMAGCGSSSSSAGGGGSHGSPAGAVNGFVSALTSWDGTSAGLNAVADWIAPAERTAFTTGFAALTAAGGSIKVSFKIDNFSISSVDSSSSDHATVHVSGTGSYCFSGGIAGVSTSFCTTASLTPSGSTNTIDTVNVGGQWYVDIGSGGSGSSTSNSTSTSTDTGTGATSSSTDTGTGSASAGTDTGSGSTATGTDTGATSSTT